MLLNSSTISVTMIASIINTMESISKSLISCPPFYKAPHRGLCKQEVQTSWEGPAAREQRFFALAKMQSLRLQAVLPVGCEAAYFVPFLGRLPHGIPCTSRIADISMDCNRAFGDGEEAPSHNTKGHPGRNWVPFFFRQAGRTGAQKLCPGGPYLPHPASCLPPHFLLY